MTKATYLKSRTINQLREEIDDCWRYYFSVCTEKGTKTLRYMTEIIAHLEERKKHEFIRDDIKRYG